MRCSCLRVECLAWSFVMSKVIQRLFQSASLLVDKSNVHRAAQSAHFNCLLNCAKLARNGQMSTDVAEVMGSAQRA